MLSGTSVAAAAVVLAGVGQVDAFWRSKFVLLDTLGTLLLTFSVSCGIIQVGRIDPVVSYGAVANHVHKIAGASNIGLSSTYASLQESDCTSCTIQADKSAYWTPALYYQHADGKFEEVPNNGMTVYYLGRGADPNGDKVAKPFPPGLKMLSGSNMARTQDLTTRTWGNKTYSSSLVSEAVSMVCINYTPGLGSQTVNMTNMNCPQGFRAQVHMQTCWDGKNLYLPDQSHMAHLTRIDNGICPPTHPVLLPHLFYEVLYSVTDFVGGDGQFVFANGDKTGFGFHGDFINGWDTATLTQAIDQCLIKNENGVVEDCPVFAASNNPNSPQICPERSPIFPCEQVKGTLDKLPGCITPSSYGHVVTSAEITCPGGNSAACTAVKTSQPVPWAGDATYAPLGCYTEGSNSRALTGDSYNSATNMTAQSCKAFCYGYKYFGVEYAQECYCGDTINTGAVSTNSSECAKDCTGNQWEICGDGSRLNMFQMNTTIYKAVKVPTVYAGDALFSSIGCYTEATGGRALSSKSYSDSKNMTAENCEAYCGKDYAYFGVEWSQECYCGKQLNSGSVAAPASECSKLCTGDILQYCGGSSRLNVFKRRDSSLVSSSTTSTSLVSSSTTSASLVSSSTTSASFISSSTTPASRLVTPSSTSSLSQVASSTISTVLSSTSVSRVPAASSLSTSMVSSSKMPSSTSSSSSSSIAPSISSSAVSATKLSIKYPEPLKVGNSSVGTWNYTGCYTEATTGRALSSAMLYGSSLTFGMTLETCAKYCYGKGNSMFGTEYGNECYCGNRLEAGAVWSSQQDDCSTKCPGNGTQYCGAGKRLNVYALLPSK